MTTETTMNPELLKSVVSQVAYFVRYGHGNVEEALDKAAGRTYYPEGAKAVYGGKPEERAEVLAAALVELGDTMPAAKLTEAQKIERQQKEAAAAISEAARISLQIAANAADAALIDQAKELDRNFDRLEGSGVMGAALEQDEWDIAD